MKRIIALLFFAVIGLGSGQANAAASLLTGPCQPINGTSCNPAQQPENLQDYNYIIKQLNLNAGGGSGNMTGPSSSTTGDFVSFGDTTGKSAVDSGIASSGLVVSAANYGTLFCDGSTDNATTINLALHSVPTGSVVTLPACGGTVPATGGGAPAALGVGYVIRSHLIVQAVELVGLGTGATIKCEVPAGPDQCIYETDTGINSLVNSLTSVRHIAIYGATGIGTTIDGLVVEGGNNISAEDVVISSVTRDGFVGQCGYQNGWLETLNLNRVRVLSSGRDNFHFFVSNNSNCFITQTTITNSTSRLPGRSAVYLDSEGLVSNSKISGWNWIGGELDGTNGSSPNVVDLVQNGGSGQPMEDVNFGPGTTIEIADSAQRSGYAIGATLGSNGGVIGTVNFTGIYFNEASGAMQTANINHYFIEACDNAVPAACRAQDSLQIQTNQGLGFSNQTITGGANTGTLLNSPVSGNPGAWLPVTINGTTRHIPAW